MSGTNGEDWDEHFFEAMLQSSEMDDAAAYHARGCPFSGDSTETLKVRWKESLGRFVERRSEDDYRLLADCTVELQKRNTEVSIQEVQNHVNRLQDCIRYEMDEARMMEAIAAFRTKLRRPDA